MNNPLFSVLIASYNNGHFIEEALESVYKQTYSNWEIIIVDDASTDTSKYIYKTLEKNSSIKIFYNDINRGAGFTKKRCIDEASGIICGFLDPDDRLVENALERMVEAHLSNNDVSLVHSTFYICDENLQNCSLYESVQNVESDNPLFFNLEYYIRHFSTFKKDFYLKTEGINPSLQRAIDQDLYLKLYEVGKTYLINLPLYYYRVHSLGISTNKNVDKAFFWHWIVIIKAAERRKVNIENIFPLYMVNIWKYNQLQNDYKQLENRYRRLSKYEKLNTFLSRIKRYFSF